MIEEFKAKVKYVHTSDVHNMRGAMEIVPVLLKIIPANSVLDVGCGLGEFLESFRLHGVLDITGIDGVWVNEAKLFMPSEAFLRADLENFPDLGRRYDLVLCLEVAEHLPQAVALSLVCGICKHGDVVLFSAAIPNQGGQNHINEQPHQYWADLFEQQGFDCYDVLRPLVWENEAIPWWYRQNIFLYVRQGKLPLALKDKQPVRAADLHTVVHPAALAACSQGLAHALQEAERYRGLYEAIMEGRFSLSSYRRMIGRKISNFFGRD